MSKKSWPILNSNLLYETGQDFLDRQYIGSRGGQNQLNYVHIFIITMLRLHPKRVKREENTKTVPIGEKV